MTRRWFVSLIYDPPAGQHSLEVFPKDNPFGFGDYSIGFRGDEVEVAIPLDAPSRLPPPAKRAISLAGTSRPSRPGSREWPGGTRATI